MSDPWLGPYTVSTITANGAYELTSKDGAVLRRRQHGVNLKLFLDRRDAVESENNYNPDDVVEKPCKKRKLSVDLSPEKQNGYQAEPDASKDDDVTVTGSEEKCNFTFSPTQSRWRVYHSHRFSLAKPRRMEKRTKTTYLGIPTQVENVDGDGNCFFRTISIELGGTQTNHGSIREAVVRFMADPSHHAAFTSYTGRPTTEYINETSMNASGTWATDTEIVATATLLQTSVYVFSTYVSTRKWLRYDPLFTVDNVKSFEEGIYLTNLNEHFNRVIACDSVAQR